MKLKSEIKQVIVLRTKYPGKDGKPTKIRNGKLAAMAAHSSLAVFLNRKFPILGWFGILLIPLNYNMIRWVTGSFAKIVVYVESEKELIDVYEKALGAGLPAAIIKDSGRTEFRGVATVTAVAIGPDLSSKIDPVTGKLPLW